MRKIRADGQKERVNTLFRKLKEAKKRAWVEEGEIPKQAQSVSEEEKDTVPEAEASQNTAKAQQADNSLTKELLALEQIGQIAEFDPSVKSVRDLPKMQNYEKFCELVRRGNSFIDAYKLANFELIMENALKKHELQMQSRMMSKMHLDPLGSRGTAMEAVPKEILDRYRSLLPESSFADIQKHYKNYAGKQF